MSLTGFTLRQPGSAAVPYRSSSNDSRLTLAVNGPTNGLDLVLVKAVDEKGLSHLGAGSSARSPGGGPSGVCQYEYYFDDLPADTRHLTVTFAVQRAREFVFRVKPEVVGTNGITIPIPTD